MSPPRATNSNDLEIFRDAISEEVIAETDDEAVRTFLRMAGFRGRHDSSLRRHHLPQGLTRSEENAAAIHVAVLLRSRGLQVHLDPALHDADIERKLVAETNRAALQQASNALVQVANNLIYMSDHEDVASVLRTLVDRPGVFPVLSGSLAEASRRCTGLDGVAHDLRYLAEQVSRLELDIHAIAARLSAEKSEAPRERPSDAALAPPDTAPSTPPTLPKPGASPVPGSPR